MTRAKANRRDRKTSQSRGDAERASERERREECTRSNTPELVLCNGSRATRVSDVAHSADRMCACRPPPPRDSSYPPLWECDTFGCGEFFSTADSFEQHYLQAHTYTCRVCSLNLPNNRLLEMHLQERHDEYFRCMAKHKKMVS
jgi:hypothetical protein